jgi:DNA-binding LacI/PurR family transcriptional regulator
VGAEYTNATLNTKDLNVADIAELAGVSRATVSRVLNGSAVVKQKTVEHIRQTMDRMGYVRPVIRPGPKPKLGSSRKPRLGSIALVTIGSSRQVFQDPIMAILVEELQHACRKRQLNLILDQMISADQVPLCVLSRQIDGAILMEFGPSENLRACISKMASLVPSVHLFAPGHPVEKIDHVTVNDVAIGGLAYQSLSASGCRSFWVVHNRDYFHEALIVRGRAMLDRAGQAGSVTRTWARPMAAGSARRFWPDPVTDFSDLSEVADACLAEEGPVGIFMTLEQGAKELAYLLERHKLLSDGKVRMVVAGNHPSLISGLPEMVQVIDLDFPELIHTALDRLLYRAKHLPTHNLTFLVPPHFTGQPAAGER